MPYVSEHPFVYLTADVVLFAVRPETGWSVLTVRRGAEPFRGRRAFPGGFVDPDEPAERAARRELHEETGLRVRAADLTQLGAYTAPRRDPRHRTVSVAFWGCVGPDREARGGDDAEDAEWRPVAELLGTRRLAFDHGTILGDAVERLQRALEHSTLATRLLPEEFTVADLRGVYELIWGRTLDPGNFQRKVLATPGFLTDTGWHTAGARGRPATLFQAGEGGEIWPPMSRTRDR